LSFSIKGRVYSSSKKSVMEDVRQGYIRQNALILDLLWDYGWKINRAGAFSSWKTFF
jgi:hypothetical protein